MIAIYIKFPYNFWGDSINDLNSSYNILYPDFERGNYIWALNLQDTSLWNESILRFDITECLVNKISYQTKYEIMDDIYNKLQQYYSFEIPYPTNIIFENWYTNQYTRGSWLNFDIELRNDSYAWLKSPVDRLFFAGEYTASEEAGYVHGAYEAGQTVGKQIVNCMKTDDMGDDCPIYGYTNATSTDCDGATALGGQYVLTICLSGCLFLFLIIDV